MTEIRGLGYLRIQTQDVARWRELVVDGLGLAVGSGPEATASTCAWTSVVRD